MTPRSLVCFVIAATRGPNSARGSAQRGLSLPAQARGRARLRPPARVREGDVDGDVDVLAGAPHLDLRPYVLARDHPGRGRVKGHGSSDGGPRSAGRSARGRAQGRPAAAGKEPVCPAGRGTAGGRTHCVEYSTGFQTANCFPETSSACGLQLKMTCVTSSPSPAAVTPPKPPHKGSPWVSAIVPAVGEGSAVVCARLRAVPPARDKEAETQSPGSRCPAPSRRPGKLLGTLFGHRAASAERERVSTLSP